jgi:pyruvate formate-lyase activating enzyme-like uncharacterized protein
MLFFTRHSNAIIHKLNYVSCMMCQQGSKMVLLVTGICSRRCFYCPLSLEKQGRRVTYANEKLVTGDKDVIFEAEAIKARGTGITGGDPLLEMNKTLHYIKILKNNFGARHNIHLYTASPDPKKVEKLAGAGLDEIRYHPPLEKWTGLGRTRFVECIKLAGELGMKAGIEIPAIPGQEKNILKLASAACESGASFLNLNELEFSESNWQELKKRGFEVKDDVSSAVLGSEATAKNVAEEFELDMTLHYCSSSFKDATQLRNRIMRRAKNTALPHEIITEEGTLLKGVIECKNPSAEMKKLAKTFGIPKKFTHLDPEKNRIEIAAWILEEISHEIKWPAFIVEEYPTADRLEVERKPLGGGK